MTDLPQYPDDGADHGLGKRDQPRRSPGSRRVYLLWAVGIGLLLLMLVLHLAGAVGPGSN
jgi:hypothetical protein